MDRRILMVWSAILLAGCASARAGRQPAAVAPDPCLRLETTAGAIVLRFDRAASPEAIAALEQGDGSSFAGLAFDFERPHLELRLEPRPADASSTVELVNDAAALGLDRSRIADAGEAMNVLQFELLPAAQRAATRRKPEVETAPETERESPGQQSGDLRAEDNDHGEAEEPATPRLAAWRERFEKDYDPSFLVGTSRQEILEALGYRFRPGLDSQPPLRGAVALVPASPTRARLELSILLADHPTRLGKWLVVGRVASGLDVAEAISLRPLADARLDDGRPRDPLTVQTSAWLDRCPDPTPGE